MNRNPLIAHQLVLERRIQVMREVLLSLQLELSQAQQDLARAIAAESEPKSQGTLWPT